MVAIPEKGNKAPAFILPDAYENNVSLEQFPGKWIVVYFYPKDNTPGCTVEANEFTFLQQDFEKQNAVILGISPDSCKSHMKFAVTYNLGIILLRDEEKEVCRKYGVWQKKINYGKEYEGVVRTTFLINPDGVIAHIWNNVTAKDHAQKVLDTLKELSSL